MATLIENIKRIEKDKEDIRAAANGKGINISEEASLDEYADAISKINKDVTANNMNMLKDVVAIGFSGEKWVGEIEERGSLFAQSRVSVYEKNQPVDTGGQQTFPAGYYTDITLPDIGLKLENYTEATATSENILEGKTAYINGEKVHGSMPYQGTSIVQSEVHVVDPSTAILEEPIELPAGYYDGVQILDKVVELFDYTQGTATAEDILMNKTAYVNGYKVTGAMNTPIFAFTPSTETQTNTATGYVAEGNIIVKGDENLVSSNILSGKTIFGVEGSSNVLNVYSTYLSGYWDTGATIITPSYTESAYGAICGTSGYRSKYVIKFPISDISKVKGISVRFMNDYDIKISSTKYIEQLVFDSEPSGFETGADASNNLDYKRLIKVYNDSRCYLYIYPNYLELVFHNDGTSPFSMKGANPTVYYTVYYE